MKSDVAVIIGRWQILQRGHQTLLNTALAMAEKVIVVLGSAWHSRDPRNPFTWQERQQMFEAVLTAEERKRVVFVPVRDYYDNERWYDAVRKGVAQHSNRTDSVTLVGFKKDHTSSYLDAFYGWKLHEVAQEVDINATDLRNVYFESSDMQSALAVLGNYVAPGVRNYLEAWSHLAVYRRAVAEHKAVVAYRKKWTAPAYLTADALVTTKTHVLLIKRGGDIGHDLWALPGGFVNPGEQFYPAAIRELGEETQYRPLPSMLRSALRAEATLDHAQRSPRGRLVSKVYHFDLGDVECPEVVGKDDAKEAIWVLKTDLKKLIGFYFEDHDVAIDNLIGGIYED
jgi:bifunctional NMN adenylyltransferase/nudix hydrolase